jgi:hypothetical protein
MDALTQQAIADDLATLANPINVITDQPWSAAEMYEYTESLIAQKQGTGQEAISNRIADASANGYRSMSEGENRYLSGPYLHRAASAGLLRKSMSAANNKLSSLIDFQAALIVFKSTSTQIAGEFALSETVKDELDNDIDNPAFVAAKNQHIIALATLSSISYLDWTLLAQRQSGYVIEDSTELLLAMINIIPTINILEAVIESNTVFKVNKRKTFENAKAELLGTIQPIDEELEVEL